eukprot:558458-Hanusia_phi.AAC.4
MVDGGWGVGEWGIAGVWGAGERITSYTVPVSRCRTSGTNLPVVSDTQEVFRTLFKTSAVTNSVPIGIRVPAPRPESMGGTVGCVRTSGAVGHWREPRKQTSEFRASAEALECRAGFGSMMASADSSAQC